MNLEEYKNQIELLKQALLFYGNKKNYENEVRYEESSLIYVDNGTQARFALEQLQKVEDVNDEINDDYLKYVSEESGKQKTPEGIINLLNEIKKAGDDGNI